MKIGRKVCIAIKYTHYTLCFAAFIWQSALISMNYFEFPTVSSTNFMIPGVETKKPITLCFAGDQMFNDELYSKIFDTKADCVKYDKYDPLMIYGAVLLSFTVTDRFNISLPHSDVFLVANTELAKYVVGRLICYQAIPRDTDRMVYEWVGDVSQNKPQAMAEYMTSPNALKNVTFLRIAMSPKDILPYFELFTSPQISIKPNQSLFIYVSSHFYRFHKLPPPYVDQCVDFRKLGYFDRYDATSDCVNNELLKLDRKVSQMKIFTNVSDHRFHLLTGELNMKKCQERTKGDNCYRELTFTEHDIEVEYEDFGYTRAIIRNIMTSKTSYITVNQPKIENVDYVTYIFGAAGTWFGFCFLSIEPVPLLEWIISKIKRDTKVEEGFSRERDQDKFDVLQSIIKDISQNFDLFNEKINLNNQTIQNEMIRHESQMKILFEHIRKRRLSIESH